MDYLITLNDPTDFVSDGSTDLWLSDSICQLNNDGLLVLLDLFRSYQRDVPYNLLTFFTVGKVQWSRSLLSVLQVLLFIVLSPLTHTDELASDDVIDGMTCLDQREGECLSLKVLLEYH